MTQNIRSWFIWLIPIFVSFGMVFGALIGESVFSDAVLKEGPDGDIAGAAAALMVVICFGSGLVMATIAIVVEKIFYRNIPERLGLRFCMSILGGGVTGIMAAYVHDTAWAWLPLICGPALTAWFCVRWKAVSCAG